jgi:hypothetical protein
VSTDRFRTSIDTSFEASESETPFRLEYLNAESSRSDYIMGQSLQQQPTMASSLYSPAGEAGQQVMESPFREELLHGNSQSGEYSGYPQQQAYTPLQYDIQQQQQLEQEQQPLLDKELEFELFASEARDPEFEDLLSELASEAEGNFLNYIRDTGGSAAELEDALAHPDSESRIDQFFEARYGQFANQIETEIDRFSAYLSQNLREDMNYAEAERVIESYQVQPDQFLGRVGGFLKKVGRGVGKVVKKGIEIAKKVALGPLQIIINKILSKIKPYIRPFLKRVIKAGLRFVPQQYRTLAQKALDLLGLNREFESEVGATELLRSEVVGEYEFEAEAHPVLHEGIAEEGEGESLEQEVYGTTELEREFDRQLFELSETSFIPYSGEAGAGSAVVSESFALEQQIPSEIVGAEAAENEATAIERARADFISGISYEGADLRQLTQNFIPAILPALKLGLRLIGRDKVVNVIANLVAKLLGNIIKPPSLATTLSRVLADVGLRLFSLEAPEQTSAVREQFAPLIVENIITETVDRVSELPRTILEAEDEVLESFVHEALVQSIANNVPAELLNSKFASIRKLPLNANWIPRRKGKYKVLSKKYTITLTPDLAANIGTWRRGETLLDVLRNYQGWDGKAPITAVIRVFETGPGATLPMIARDYVGGTSQAHIRQIIPLTNKAATMLLNEPRLRTSKRMRKSMTGRRFYSIRLASLPTIQRPTSSPGSATTSYPTAAATAAMVEPIRRNNDAIVKFISPNRLEARIYLNEPTAQRIRSASPTRLASELYTQIESLVVPIGTRVIDDILLRLKVPAVVKKEIVSLLIGWVVKILKTQLGNLTKSFPVTTGRPEQGVTVIVSIELPKDFVLAITKLNIVNLGAFVSRLISVTPSARIDILAGYKL